MQGQQQQHFQRQLGLPPCPSTSAQNAELITLTKALQLGKDKTINVYTDSRYAFAVHDPRSIYRERGLLTAEGKTIKNKQEILLLSALWLLQRLAIIYCPGHQKGDSYKAQGNKRTDQAAKEAALYVADSLIIMPDPMLPEKPEYSTQDNKDTASFMNTRVKMGESIQQTNDSFYQLHWLSPQSTNSQGTHLGQRKLKELLRHLRFKIFNMDKLLEDCVTKCLPCQATNPQKKDCWLCLDPRPLFTQDQAS